MENNDRIRRVDVEKLDVGKVEDLSKRIGDKLSKLLQKASDEANQLLNIYGVEVQLNYTLKPKKPENKGNK